MAKPKQASEPDELLSMRETAARLGISEKSVYRYTKAGRLIPASYQKPERGGQQMPLYRAADVERLRTDLKAPPIQTADQLSARSGRLASLDSAVPTPIPSIPGSVHPPSDSSGLEAFVAALAAAIRKADREDNRTSTGLVQLSGRLALTTAEAAEMAGTSEDRIRKACATGALPAIKNRLGRGWRIRPVDLYRYVDSFFA
jgi:excisionase family DNA binding protein